MTYSAEVLADTPLGYWRLGEASGNPLDSSGNGRTGTLTGTPGRVTGLLVGDANGCFDFDGSTTWVDTPVTGTGQPAISAEALISLDGNNKVQNIHGRADEASGGSFVQFILRVSAANKAEFSARKGGAWVTATGTTTLAIGTAYHIAGTADGSSVKIYVNGVLETTVSNASAMVSVSTLGGLIGAGWNGANYAKFDGKIDEVAFYASALSATRIAAHFAATGLPTTLAAAGTASLSLTASGGTSGSAAGAAALSLSASGGATAAAAGSASLALTAAGALIAPTPAAGAASLALSAAGGASGSPAGTASLNLAATGAAIAVLAASGSATLTLTASGSAVMSTGGTATLTLSAVGVAAVLYLTDTANGFNGRTRGARATVTITRPLAPLPPGRTFGVRYDKAIAYPTPDMVDGRPT